MKEKLITLLMVSVMVVSAFGAMGLSATKVGAAGEIATTLRIDGHQVHCDYDPYGSKVCTEKWVGYLKETNTGKPIAGATVKLETLVVSDGQSFWTEYASNVTDGNGRYYLPHVTSGVWQILFEGNTFYSPSITWLSQSYTTTLTLAASTTSPGIGQKYTLSGLLTDSAGKPLANKPINILYQFPGDATWHFSNTVYTDANGYYSTTASSSKNVYLQAGYKVNGVYVAGSNLVAINVGPKGATTLTLTASNTKPTDTMKYTLYGILRDANGNGIANKPIDIFYHFVGEGWRFSNTIYTDADGYYSTTTSSSKTIILQTGYKVGGVYVASSNVVTVNARVGTTLTLAASTMSPGIGQKYTLSGLLTDSAGNGLANKPIEIWYHILFVDTTTWWHYSNTVYTGADGKYSTTTTSSKDIFIQARFQGDNVYISRISDSEGIYPV